MVSTGCNGKDLRFSFKSKSVERSFVRHRVLIWNLDFEVESDPVCKSILQTRMREGNLPFCPIYDDVREYRPSGDALRATWLLAGFPCQV